MDMDNQNLFIFDGCYAKPASSLLNDNSFNYLLEISFNRYITSNVRECEVQALRSNSDFFLVNDLSSNGNNKTTKCYIPRSHIVGSSVIGDDSTLAKGFRLFNSIFGTLTTTANGDSYAYTKQQLVEPNNNLLLNLGLAPANHKCFEYTLDKKVYAPKKYYAYYKTPLLSQTNIDLTKNAKSPKEYRDKLVTLDNYKDLLKFDATTSYVNGAYTISTGTYTNTTNGPLARAIMEFVCSTTSTLATNQATLNANIDLLKNCYTDLFTSLDEISQDLSNINYLNSLDNNTITALNARINDRKKQLNSLMGFGGANNGRLSDTTFLAQFKIVENSVLILIIITVIFIYYKTKKAG